MKKNRLLRIFLLAMTLPLLLGAVACVPEDEPVTDPATESSTPEETTSEEPTEESTEPVEPKPDPATDGKLRVMMASDLHYTTIETYFGWDPDTRMQHFVDSLLLEHEREPIDLLILAGDLSLDHLFARGTWTKSKVSTTKTFMEKYASQITAAGIPIFTLAGNHEQFNEKQWEEIVGNKRYGTIEMEGNLFILLDSYGSTLEPNYDTAGGARYTPMDVGYIKYQLKMHPNCDKVYLVTHGFWPKADTAAFAELMRTEDRILGIFSGDSHDNTVLDLGASYGNKKNIQTGNWAGSNATNMEERYSKFWGFRELLITPDSVVSNYIVAKTKIVINGVVIIDVDRTVNNSIQLY